MQETHVTHNMKGGIKKINYVFCFHFAPHKLIDFHVHPLHMAKIATKMGDKKKLKKDIPIKLYWEEQNFFILNSVAIQTHNSFVACGAKHNALM
jgi:hypothetical protein